MRESSTSLVNNLRRHLIIIATVTVAMLLGVVLVGLTAASFYTCYADELTVLKVIIENDGEMPAIDQSTISAKPSITFEASSQVRYYSAYVDGETVASLDLDHISSVTEDQARDLALAKFYDARADGYFTINNNDYMFLRERDSETSGLIVITNCTTEFRTARILLGFSLYFGLGFTALFAIIMLFASKRVVAPFIKNLESQRQFITNAGHELKTPVAVIQANVELIEMMDGESEWTQSIAKQTRRLSKLVNRLIALARLQEQDDLKLEMVSFTSAVNKSVESYRPVVERDGKTLSVSIEDGVMVKAESRALLELVNILVDNARKYCDAEGEVSVTLARVNAMTGRKRARLTVSNTYAAGEGIDYERFFDRFYREDASHNAQTMGFGIGLSMAQQIVENFNGKIGVTYEKPNISFVVLLS